MIRKVKNTVPRIYAISAFNGEETAGMFHEKGFQKTNQKEFRFEKVIKRNIDKLLVRWNG